MLNIKRWLILLLDLSLMFSIVPIDCFAQGTHDEAHVDFDTNTTMPVVVPEADDPEVIDTTPNVNTQSQETTVIDTPVETQNEEGQVVPLAEPQTNIAYFSDAFANAFASQLITYGLATSQTVSDFIVESGNDLTLKVGDKASILILLSHMPQKEGSNYSKWTIDFNITGSLSLNSEVPVPDTENKLTYDGLGDKDFPFAGKFTGNLGGLSSSHTIFKYISSNMTINLNGSTSIGITWSGAQNEPILAKQIVVADSEAKSLNYPLNSSTTFSPYIGEITGDTGELTIGTLNYSGASNTYQNNEVIDENLGLVCNHMGENTSLKIGQITLTNQADLRGSANVGVLVGKMDSGSTLLVGSDLTLNAKIQGDNAGGLVGHCEGSLFIDAGKNVIVAEIVSGQNAGGIAGKIDSVNGLIVGEGNLTINSISVIGENNAGGLYGECSISGEFEPLKKVSIATTPELTGNGSNTFCGGLFGTLRLTTDGKCKIEGSKGDYLNIISNLVMSNNNVQYGGIAGTLSGIERKHALIVNYAKVTTEIKSDLVSSNYPKKIGGLVAVQGTKTTIDAKNSAVTLKNPKTPIKTYGIGGLCTDVENGALLIADTMKIMIDSFVSNQGSSGIAATTGQGSIVYLKNSIDLLEALLETCECSGQIVGKQNCSLVYAPNVSISRLHTTINGKSYDGVELDDIGNYGELYRIPDFVKIVENTYETKFQSITGINNNYTFSSAIDYACFALAWQSRGYFPTVKGIDNNNWTSLKTSIINLSQDIDLTNVGIGGLTRDTYDSKNNDDVFTGTINGKGRKIKLNIGTANSHNQVAKGDGRIYWHNATGLFAAVSSLADINNLLIEGVVRISNSKKTPMYSGALAATINGDREQDSTLKTITSVVSYDAVVSGANQLYLGGLIGSILSGNSRIDFSGSSITTTLTISHSGNGSNNHFGGVIGAITENASASLYFGKNSSATTIKGSINSAASISNLYCGALIGTVFPNSSRKREINIDNLTIEDYSIIGNPSERMSGILGGVWANSEVTINGLTVNNSSLESNGTAAAGGLVYRASGKWMLSNISISGLNISVGKAAALGLIACHGERHDEVFNGTSKDTGALYLEMENDWETGYTVPSSITFNGDVFDEFVAYTAYRNNDSYDIAHNGSGVISLKTSNKTVNMTSGERNTYQNRTEIGQSKQTNKYSRYYYNLKYIMDTQPETNDGLINSAPELLIWSVNHYSDSSIQKYFSIKGIDSLSNNYSVGGTSSSKADFNMDGYSYYPIDLVNVNATVEYANVVFYNEKIELQEINNKTTRGNDDDHSQHYMMHCALFLNFTAEKITETMDYTMTVNGVTFAGTVGLINNGSGALLCGDVKGESTSGNTATCKVILADADDSKKAVSLNGLSVLHEGDYAPVLINKLGSYAGITANYATTTDKQTDKAGSSLIGNVGGQGATGVSIVFAGTIKLPEQKEGEGQVFTKATLLNSLQYADGSATYTFVSEKDDRKHDTTHGFELSESVEYAGKCGYYDDDTNGTKNIPCPDGQKDFMTYLPYVANSPATDETNYPLSGKWHELAVNIHSEPLTDGCGTYGHPYKVTAMELREAANYINNGVAFTGWQVRMPGGDTYHTDETDEAKDIILTYKNGGWKKEDESPYDGDVRAHLQSAYYHLVYAKDEKGTATESTITLNNFPGIGTNPDWAFKGVITGKIDENKNVSVTLTGGSSSFIKYSYGSVVRDVTLQYQHENNQQLSLSWEDPGRTTDGTTKPQQSPTTFFGGVIGSVLGGDNIIENVTVSINSNFKLTLDGTKPYLIPVGGYVGVIAGGGVIFRGTYSHNTGISGNDTQLYRNPIIGRVLGGYAFYEGTGATLDNGNKNYKINTLNPAEENSDHDLDWDGSTLTVNSAQGLLILSAIVSSGAGSESSNAYKNGVARKALYDYIGNTTEPSDYGIARNDVENSDSYLSHYVNVSGAYISIKKICTDGIEGITIIVAKDVNDNPITLDMSKYKNGYRGLSARYVSNAAFSESTVTPSAVVMRVKSFNGQDATVNGIDMNVEEYADDDFHMASMGGIFNIVWTKQNGGGSSDSTFAKDLKIYGLNVSLKYINNTGAEQKQADTSTFDDKDGLCAVAVGGFIGSISDDGNTVKTKDMKGNYLFEHIEVKGISDKKSIYGPNSAGGIIGASAMTSSYLKGYPGILLSNKRDVRLGPNFLNCSYENINITGKLAAGGIIGVAYAFESPDVQFGSMGTNYSSGNYCFASITSTDDSLIVGKNATITASSQHGVSAGIFGVVGMRSAVNYHDINNQTGLSIALKQDMKTVSLNNVDIESSTKNDVIYRSDGKTVNGPDKSDANTASGGIIGRISHVNQSYIYDVNMAGITVNAKTQVSGSYSGGIIAYGYTDTMIVVQDCVITNSSSINGKYAGGLLGYGWGGGGFNLHVSDCKISESIINGASYAGGLVGRAAGIYNLTNILIKNSSITGNNTKCGRLFGNMHDPTGTFNVRAAGISVYVDKNRGDVVIPANDGDTTTYNGYITYADYAGMETEVAGEKSPYVTVNPSFQLKTDKKLYGDAVKVLSNEDNIVSTVASRIWADQKTGVTNTEKLNVVPYNSVSAITSKALPEISTFKAVQGVGPEDLPVLMIKGGDATVIEDYLNVITNGGYEKAKAITKTAKKEEDKVLVVNVEVYSYEKNDSGGAFVKKTREELNNAKAPASIYLDGNDIKVLGNSYDNTRNRFSLVEATFKAKVNGTDRTYTVSVPVVVIRELQYDFMATLTYGAEFQKSTYDTLENHVLESAGNPITAYLTYSYNREKGKYVPYDWQSYMESGGSMLNIDKMLDFSNGFPKDTQLILVDCQNGNRAYQYKVGDGGIDNVLLSSFTSLTGGEAFYSSMADILGVTKSPSNAGKFFETSDVSSATVKLKGKYYRLYQDGDKGERYDLTVPDLEENNPRENYYLLINVPKQTDANYFLNGSIKNKKLVWNMPSRCNQVHRFNETSIDNVSNTESTYQFYSGYQQKLESLTQTGEAINLLDTSKKMQVAFKDTITFSSKQAYGDNDSLFAKFNISLRKYTKNSSSPEDLQFAVGTSGTVHFYIQDSSGKYYTYNGTTWSTHAEKKEVAKKSYDWVSQGNNMELLLSLNGKEALDLAGVRQMIKQNNSLQSEIIITTKMDVQFNDQDVINATVPASDQHGTDVWAQLHYVAMLSAQASSLGYSSNRLAENDNAHYYRSVKYAAVLSLDAALIDQLGVNPLEPVEDYMTFFDGKESANIELNASLDLKNLPDYENTLKASKEIRFSLSLEKRDGGDTYTVIEDATSLIGFKWKDDSQGWSWNISQDQYIEKGVLKESELYSAGRFSFPIEAYVSMEPREFANYKIKLTVSFIDDNDNTLSVLVEDSDAYVVYTYASIKPTFYTFISGN